MTEHQTLSQYLRDWAGDDELRITVSETTRMIADACCAISEIISLGPLAGDLGARQGQNVDGDTQAALDIRANEPFQRDDVGTRRQSQDRVHKRGGGFLQRSHLLLGVLTRGADDPGPNRIDRRAALREYGQVDATGGGHVRWIRARQHQCQARDQY